jgi:hypothetical protein
MDFIQGNTVQKWIWSSLLSRSTLKDSIEIYFIFCWILLYFLHILEIYTNIWNFKRQQKTKNRGAQWWVGFGQSPGTVGLAQSGKQHAAPALRALSVITVSGSRVCRHGDALTGGKVFLVNTRRHPGWRRARLGRRRCTVEAGRRWGEKATGCGSVLGRRRRRLQCASAPRVEGGEARDHLSQRKDARGVELTEEGGRRWRQL